MSNKVADEQPRLLPSSWHLLELHSEWRGVSEFRVRVRKLKDTGKMKRIVVDVTELTYGAMADNRTAIRLARSRVRKFGINSVDSSTLCDYRADTKANMLDGSVALLKRRHCSYSFLEA